MKPTTEFKILFLNVQTLTELKLDFIIELLIDFDIICLSEVNNRQQLLNNLESNICKFHFDPNTTRLAMITRNSINFSYLGTGLSLDQERIQIDQTIAQSNFYRITLANNKIFELENIYITPDANSNNLESIGKFLNGRSWSNKMFIGGGDFNVNWKNAGKRKKLNLSTTLDQNVKDYTRVRHYVKDGSSRVSKTIIDLILTNRFVKPYILGTEILNTSNLPFFDHFGVILKLNFPKSKPYRDIELPQDPFRRKPIDAQKDPEQFENIKNAIDGIEHNKCYDRFMMGVRGVLDRFSPMSNKLGTFVKRIYDFPFPKEIRIEITKKHTLQQKAKNHPTEQNRLEFKKHRNKLTKTIRNFKKEHTTKKLLQQNSSNAIDTTIKFLQKTKSEDYTSKPRTIISGKFGTDLVNDLGIFLKGRADLVKTEDIENSPPLTEIFEENEIPENKLILTHFPKIDDIYKVIPKNKITKTASMDGVSSQTLVEIWPIIKSPMNEILTSSLKFPAIDQGYYQRVISKSSIKQPVVYEDMRPLGILNAIPKYGMSKFVWTEIRKHIAPILKNRNIMTYKGCKMPIINTLDNAIIQVFLKYFVIIQKFDFSNAFGTLFLSRLMEIMNQLNLCDEILDFITSYIKNQSYCGTVMNDGSYGIFISKIMNMVKGIAQGQCGADVAFTCLQFGLSPAENIYRNAYMDDLNDVIKWCLTALAAINLAKKNDDRLTEQAVRVGFKKNTLKTTYIPVNFPKSLVIESGIPEKYVVQSTGILGFNFNVINKKFCVLPAANDIVSSLNSHLQTVHSTRTYVANHLDRLKITRKLIYNHLGFISLVYAYGVKTSRNPGFQKVQVAVNDLIRATGLRPNTPQHVLDKCLGTSLTDFALHSVIIDGKKELIERNLEPDIYDRIHKIRTTDIEFSVQGTFMNFFAEKWNNFDRNERQVMAELDITKLKDYLKKKRVLTYEADIFTNYYWIDLRVP